MTVAEFGPAPAMSRRAAPLRRWTTGRRTAEITLASIVFLGAFVIYEPAPYDLALVAVITVWAFCGLRISRYILPLVILLLFYLVGGILAFGELRSYLDPLIYFATTVFLAASAILYAAVIPIDPARRLAIIMKAYVAGAAVAALIGVLAYFGAFPRAEFFTLYQRARGPFQDPNVFGPFLVLPLVYLIYYIFTHCLRDSLVKVVLALIILLGIFLSFSRAAWGMTVFALLITTTLAYINQRNPNARARLVLYVVLGGAAVVMLLAVALSLPAVSGLFSERARVVQDYDAGELGRFERHVLGFFLVFDKPFGLGPFEFGKTFGGDEHNMWLKGFTVYGWLGGFSYIALVIWTLIVSTPLLFKQRPWQPVIICAFAVYLGHLLIHNVIDNDHWRHLFLIYGILWGGYAAERLHRRAQIAQAAAAIPPPAPVFRAAIARVPHPP